MKCNAILQKASIAIVQSAQSYVNLLASLGIMETQLSTPLKPLNTIECCDVRIVPLELSIGPPYWWEALFSRKAIHLILVVFPLVVFPPSGYCHKEQRPGMANSSFGKCSIIIGGRFHSPFERWQKWEAWNGGTCHLYGGLTWIYFIHLLNGEKKI